MKIKAALFRGSFCKSDYVDPFLLSLLRASQKSVVVTTKGLDAEFQVRDQNLTDISRFCNDWRSPMGARGATIGIIPPSLLTTRLLYFLSISYLQSCPQPPFAVTS